MKRLKPACPKRNRRVLHVSESKVLSSLHSQHPNPIIHWSQLSFPTPDYPVPVLLCGGTFHFSLWPRLLALTASLPASLPNSPSMTDHSMFHACGVHCLDSTPAFWGHPGLSRGPSLLALGIFILWIHPISAIVMSDFSATDLSRTYCVLESMPETP